MDLLKKGEAIYHITGRVKIGNILLQPADGDVGATLSLAAPTVALEPLSIVARASPARARSCLHDGSRARSGTLRLRRILLLQYYCLLLRIDQVALAIPNA
jgi:hypothetical protein